MAHANAIFLTLLSGGALVLGLAPGCSNNSTPTAEVAIVWNVDVGPSGNAASCPVGAGDSFTIGSFTGGSLVTASNGSTFNNVPVNVSCSVVQNGANYTIAATVQYGQEGALTLTGTIVGASGLPSTWPAQTGIQASFNDHLGLIEDLNQNSGCTVTFTQNANMGIAPSRIWGYIDCPQATSEDGKSCDANAQFLFEDCEQ